MNIFRVNTKEDMINKILSGFQPENIPELKYTCSKCISCNTSYNFSQYTNKEQQSILETFVLARNFLKETYKILKHVYKENFLSRGRVLRSHKEFRGARTSPVNGGGKSNHVTVRCEDKIEDIRGRIENDWLLFSGRH